MTIPESTWRPLSEVLSSVLLDLAETSSERLNTENACASASESRPGSTGADLKVKTVVLGAEA